LIFLVMTYKRTFFLEFFLHSNVVNSSVTGEISWEKPRL
jgi:hypothetical protein